MIMDITNDDFYEEIRRLAKEIEAQNGTDD